MNEQIRMSFVPEKLSIKAMRSNGFKSTDTAIAELIDNSIQAGLKVNETVNVDVVCVEETSSVGNAKYISEIYVLDDAGGMAPDLMRRAIQFGQGTNLDQRQQKGMGKFGMGLPNSSISQCERLDVYSWQTADQVHTVYMDLTEIYDGILEGVPETKEARLPKMFYESEGRSELKIASSGTLVSWTKIDRATWRTHRGFFKNAEFLIGRMYRHFINDGTVKIRLLAYEKSKSGICKKIDQRLVKPNDPLMLMKDTCAPEPFDQTPAFNEHKETVIDIKDTNGVPHSVTIRASYRGSHVIDHADELGKDPGSTPIGQFVAKNVGVSVVRAGRELCLSQEWTKPGEYTERWWGLEIQFPPALDEVLGVSNDKQQASNIGRFDADEEDDIDAFVADFSSQNPSVTAQRNISQKVKNVLNSLRKTTNQQRAGSRKKGPSSSKVTKKVKKWLNTKGSKNATQTYGNTSVGAKKTTVEGFATKNGATPTAARLLAEQFLADEARAQFIFQEFTNFELFSWEQENGIYQIKINSMHPAIKALALGDENGDFGPEETAAMANLQLLFVVWADYEAGLEGAERSAVQKARVMWGLKLDELFNSDSE